MIQNILSGKLRPDQMQGQMTQPMSQMPMQGMMPQQPMQVDPYGQQMGNLRQILMGGMR
jgi:hypothetical protein